MTRIYTYVLATLLALPAVSYSQNFTHGLSGEVASCLSASIVADLSRMSGRALYNQILAQYNCQARPELSPILRTTSPLADSQIAPGQSQIGKGNGSNNKANFVVTVEVVERDGRHFRVNEATPVFGIHNVPLLTAGKPNPSFPKFFFFFDADLINPDGVVLPAFQNFASAFNVAGTDDTPGAGVTTWLGWHVLESMHPRKDTVTMTAAAVDDAGRIALDTITLNINSDGRSGQLLTPGVETFSGIQGREDGEGPEVSMIAPRVPTSLSVGPTDKSLNATNGSLFYIQVSALDRQKHGIAVSANGSHNQTTTDPNIPLGLIFDPTQIGVHGPNRHFPGLEVTFDVPLRQPNGNIVVAGANLAPLFDVAGNEVDASGAVRTTADWVVGGSLVMPDGKHFLTINSKATDNEGHTGSTQSILSVSNVVSGQDLTPAP